MKKKKACVSLARLLLGVISSQKEEEVGERWEDFLRNSSRCFRERALWRVSRGRMEGTPPWASTAGGDKKQMNKTYARTINKTRSSVKLL